MSDNAFRDYLLQIGKYPLLTANEELELGKRIKEEHDSTARATLINSNLRLVVKVAKGYRNSYLGIDDLVAEGNTGLITAVDKYDYTLGYRFSTCAVPWIRQAILHALTDKSRPIRLPAQVYQALNRVKKWMSTFASEHGHDATIAEVAEGMKMTTDEVERLLSYQTDVVSLDLPTDDAERTSIADLVEGDNVSMADFIDARLTHDQLVDVIHSLKPRCQTVIKMRYGLAEPNDPAEFSEPHTLEDVGAYIGVTRERARQLEKESLQNMKLIWENRYHD